MGYWLSPAYWSIEPVVIVGVEVAAVLYVVGRLRRLRVLNAPRIRPTWRDAAFFGGLAAILLALDTPIDTLAKQLFWMHMVQHLLLIVVAAPLLVVAAPGMRLWRGLPLSWRRPVAGTVLKSRLLAPLRSAFRFIARPAPAFVLSTVNFWFWHLPQAYDLTLRSHLVHHLEHSLFLGLSLLFWTQVIDQPPFHCRLGYLQRAGYVFLGTVQSWLLAAILGLSGTAFYAYTALASRPGDISALVDQQIGAGVMWVPGSVTYAIVFIACLFLWLDAEENRVALGTASSGIGGPRAG